MVATTQAWPPIWVGDFGNIIRARIQKPTPTNADHWDWPIGHNTNAYQKPFYMSKRLKDCLKQVKKALIDLHENELKQLKISDLATK